MLDLDLNFQFENDKIKEKFLHELPSETAYSISSEITHSSIATSKASIGLSVKVFQTNSEKRPNHFQFEEKSQTQLLYSISGDTELGLIKGVFGLRINAKHQLLFASQHPKNTLLKDCLIKDLKAFPVMYDQKDVEGLQEGQVVGLGLDRGAELGMEFSWSNIISRSISGLTGLGVDPKTISLDISPRFFVDLKYSLEDSLLLLAKKSKDDLIEFAVTKANQMQSDINTGVKVNLKLSDNKVFQQLLHDTGDQMMEDILGTKLQKLDTLLKDTNQTKQNLKTYAWYPKLEKLIDLDSLEIPDIKKELDSVKSNIIEKIQTSISKNTELAIRYEYRKTKTKNEVLHFGLPLDKIQQYHPSLVKFELSDILRDFRENKLSRQHFHQYLNQKTQTVKRSLGLGLTLFDKKLFSVLGEKSKHESITKNLAGHQSIHYQVGSGYEGKLGSWTSKWYSEITLDMDGFSDVPSLQEADFSQYLSLSAGEKINKLEDLQILLDTGVIWGAILPEKRNELANSLFPKLKNQTIEIQSTIAIHGEGYENFLEQISKLAKDYPRSLNSILGSCLAMALPYLDGHEVRMDIQKREQAYKQAFHLFIEKPGTSLASLTNVVADNILKTGPQSNENMALSKKERMALYRKSSVYFGDLVLENSNISEKWGSVGSKFVQLYESISKKESIIDHFKNIERGIREIPTASLHCRALGALLNIYAQRNAVIEKHTVRTVEIFVKGGSTIVLSPLGGPH
jgi:hypothetical protein